MLGILTYPLVSVVLVLQGFWYWKECTCMKSLVNDLVFTSDKIVDMPETTSVNPNDKTNYWFIGVVLLAMACFVGGHYLYKA